jgi:hypothetical protein
VFRDAQEDEAEIRNDAVPVGFRDKCLHEGGILLGVVKGVWTMALPADLGTWGFILSLLALILMYPVGLLVNLSTPHIRDWWAGRSRSETIKRIEILEKWLQDAEKLESLTAFQDETLWLIRNLLTYVGMGVHLVLGALTMSIVYVYSIAHSKSTYLESLGAVVSFSVVNLVVLRRHRMWADKYRRPRSLESRESVRKNIEALKARLR